MIENLKEKMLNQSNSTLTGGSYSTNLGPS
jgi:hypothetical protein